MTDANKHQSAFDELATIGAVAKKLGNPRLEALCIANRALPLASLGEFDAAMAALSTALTKFERLPDSGNVAKAHSLRVYGAIRASFARSD